MPGYPAPPETEMQELSGPATEEPYLDSMIHTPEQRSDKTNADSTESLEFWPGTALTDEELRRASKKNDETGMIIAQKLRHQLKPEHYWPRLPPRPQSESGTKSGVKFPSNRIRQGVECGKADS